MDLGAVLKRGQDLLRRSHGDDTQAVQKKLLALEDRYAGQFLVDGCTIGHKYVNLLNTNV